MSINDVIDNVKSSFAMEGMILSAEDISNGRQILIGEKSADEIIKDIIGEYSAVNK